MIFRALGLIGMASVLAVPASEAEAPQSTISDRPKVRLARPDSAPLKDDELRNALAGYKLTLDEGFIQSPDVNFYVFQLGGCPPIEVFSKDGSWLRGVCAIVYQVNRGTWTVKGSEVCVVDAYKEVCRRAWRTKKPGYLILTFPEIPGEFNPYRLTPQ